MAKFIKSYTENKGHASAETIDNFYAVGYTNSNLIDAVIIVGDKIISNYLHNLTDVPVDWPLAPEL